MFSLCVFALGTHKPLCDSSFTGTLCLFQNTRGSVSDTHPGVLWMQLCGKAVFHIWSPHKEALWVSGIIQQWSESVRYTCSSVCVCGLKKLLLSTHAGELTHTPWKGFISDQLSQRLLRKVHQLFFVVFQWSQLDNTAPTVCTGTATFRKHADLQNQTQFKYCMMVRRITIVL